MSLSLLLDEHGDFCLKSGNIDDSMKKLETYLKQQEQEQQQEQQKKQTDNDDDDDISPRNFKININETTKWNDKFLTTIIEVFRSFFENDIKWNAIDIYDSSSSNNNNINYYYYIRPLLYAAHTMSLFKCLKLHYQQLPSIEDEEDDDATATTTAFLLHGSTLNKRLESIEIYLGGGRRSGGEMSMGDYQVLKQLLSSKSSSKIKELTLFGLVIRYPNCTKQLDMLRQGLVNNTTINKLTIKLNSPTRDVELSNIILSLTGNQQQINTLTLLSDNKFGDLSSKAIETLLQTTTTIRTLVLHDLNRHLLDGKLNAEHILNGIKNNISLKNVYIYNALYGDMILSRFFKVIVKMKHPTIEKLHLKQMDITKYDFDEIINTTTSCGGGRRLQQRRRLRPIVLEIDDKYMKRFTKEYYDMLYAYPEIRRQWPTTTNNNGVGVGAGCYTHCNNREIIVSTDQGRKLQHVMKMNWYGRYLLFSFQKEEEEEKQKSPTTTTTTTTTISNSIWPLVLEKANNEPSVLYEFLKGPAFAER